MLTLIAIIAAFISPCSKDSALSRLEAGLSWALWGLFLRRGGRVLCTGCEISGQGCRALAGGSRRLQQGLLCAAGDL